MFKLTRKMWITLVIIIIIAVLFGFIRWRFHRIMDQVVPSYGLNNPEQRVCLI